MMDTVVVRHLALNRLMLNITALVVHDSMHIPSPKYCLFFCVSDHMLEINLDVVVQKF